MADYKVVDIEQLETDLASVADAIRTKGNTTDDLEFPQGFVDGIGAIESGGGDLPDWDDDSPIIATGKGYVGAGIWELTEKGTMRWVDGISANAYFCNSTAISVIPLEILDLLPKIRQYYVPDGIQKTELACAVNCERIRLPYTLNSTPSLAGLSSLKELDLSNATYTTIPSCGKYTKLERVILSTAFTEIGSYTFEGCYSLADINLENITTFKSKCFNECFGLVDSIAFNPNLVSIESQAFYRTRIKSVKYQNLVDNLPTIASNAFAQCRELKAIFCPWAEGAVANAGGGAPNATIYYNVTYDENGNPVDESGEPIIVEVQ